MIMFSFKGTTVIFILLLLLLGALLFQQYQRYRSAQNEISDLSTFASSNERFMLHIKEMQTSDIVDQLQYVHNVNARFENPGLDLIWNNEKQCAISNLVAELNHRTGDNLGDNPEAWSKKYGYDATNAASSTSRNNK